MWMGAGSPTDTSDHSREIPIERVGLSRPSLGKRGKDWESLVGLSLIPVSHRGYVVR